MRALWNMTFKAVRSVGNQLMRPIRFIGSRFLTDVGVFLTDCWSLLQPVVKALIHPFRWISKHVLTDTGVVLSDVASYQPMRVLGGWFSTRSPRDLLLGLPAAIAALLLVFGITAAFFGGDPTTMYGYVDLANQARISDDEGLAKLYLRKASLAARATPESRFALAILLISVDQEQDALAIIHRLAPEDKPGYVPAHEWVIQALGRELAANLQLENPTDAQLALRADLQGQIVKQMEFILEVEPNHQLANERLAQVRLDEGDIDAALVHLARAVGANGALRLPYAQLLAHQGDVDEARTAAQEAVVYHQEMLERLDLDEAAEAIHRRNLATSLMLTGRHERAAKILLTDGQIPEDPRMRRLLSEALFLWSESFEVIDAATLIQKMELLDDALKLRPDDERILARLAVLAGMEGEAGSGARRALKTVLSSGRAPATVHFILGMHAYQQQQMELALKHWELAYRANPNMPIMLNNLAMLVSRRDPPDLQRALGLIEKAIELDPKVGDFYDSRAQIYLKMEAYTDAIADLEVAIGRHPGRADIYGRLAEAYEAIGASELAQIHRDHESYFKELAVKKASGRNSLSKSRNED